MHLSNLPMLGLGLLLGAISVYGWKGYAKYLAARRKSNPDVEQLYTSPEMVTFISLFSIFELIGGIFF